MAFRTTAVLVLMALLGQSAFAATGVSVSLGSSWNPVEEYQGATFRWVDNDAEFSVGGSGEATIDLEVEAGPGIGTGSFLLQVLDSHRQQVDALRINGRQAVQLYLPAGHAYLLHTTTGGRRVPTDKRILNFRVFALASEPGDKNVLLGDIGGPNVSIADGWYAPEFFHSEVFRWVDNNANFVVRSPRAGHGSLHLLFERGPGMGKTPLRLTVTDGHGHAVHLPPVGGRAAINVPVDFEAGINRFRLSTAGGGAHIKGDRRILNFRVISIGATLP